MDKLKWDRLGERYYETGVDHGVLYPQVGGVYQKGVAWNGLTSVASNPSGAESNAFYADNIKYFNMTSAETFGATLGCYYYPDEFKQCNGQSEITGIAGMTLGQQRRNQFGFSYRTKKGNDSEGEDYGYKIHLLYGCQASPSSTTYSSVNESPEPGELSYEITTTPIDVSGKGPDGKPYKPVSEIVFDSSETDPNQMAVLELILYGFDGDAVPTIALKNENDRNAFEAALNEGPMLPLPDELIKILAMVKKIDTIAIVPDDKATIYDKNASTFQEDVKIDDDGNVTGTFKEVGAPEVGNLGFTDPDGYYIFIRLDKDKYGNGYWSQRKGGIKRTYDGTDLDMLAKLTDKENTVYEFGPGNGDAENNKPDLTLTFKNATLVPKDGD